MVPKSDSGIDKMIAINCEYFENVEDENFPWENTPEPNTDDVVADVDETIKINPPEYSRKQQFLPLLLLKIGQLGGINGKKVEEPAKHENARERQLRVLPPNIPQRN